MSRPTRDTAAGRAYLDLRHLGLRQSRGTGELLALYALEGFLDRLVTSPQAGDFVLKGGVLLAAYDSRRPTRDVDLQATDLNNDTSSVLTRVRAVAALMLPDGLVYDTAGATAQVIRDDDHYSGVRVSMSCRLATARIGFHVDINVGDPVWPAPGLVTVPRLLGGGITLRGYPLSMIYAEKIVTAVQRGTANTRWRDFADIYLLSGRHPVDGTELERSLRTVATHRSVDLAPLVDILDEYSELSRTSWAGWVRRQHLDDRLSLSFSTVLHEVAKFADPVLRGEAVGRTWDPAQRRWPPGGSS